MFSKIGVASWEGNGDWASSGDLRKTDEKFEGSMVGSMIKEDT